MADQICVSALTATHLDRQHILRRTVELLEGKRADEPRNIRHRERDDDVDIVRHARLAVHDPRCTAGHHVWQPEPLETAHERCDETR